MVTREDAMIVNALVRQALTSAQEVMGENGLNTVLRTSGLERFIGNFPPDNLEPSIQASQYAKLNEAIEAFYGRGGRGMVRHHDLERAEDLLDVAADQIFEVAQAMRAEVADDA